MFGAQATGDDVLALGPAGRAGLVEAGVGAVGIETEDHRFDAVDAEISGEREDGLGEAAADDGDLPTGRAELVQRGFGGGLDRRDILRADRFQFGLGRLDDVEALGEDRLHRRSAVHGRVGHILDGFEGLRTAQAAEFIDPLDGREGRITVEKQEFRGHEGVERAPPIRSRLRGVFGVLPTCWSAARQTDQSRGDRKPESKLRSLISPANHPVSGFPLSYASQVLTLPTAGLPSRWVGSLFP